MFWAQRWRAARHRAAVDLHAVRFSSCTQLVVEKAFFRLSGHHTKLPTDRGLDLDQVSVGHVGPQVETTARRGAVTHGVRAASPFEDHSLNGGKSRVEAARTTRGVARWRIHC